MHVDLLTLYLLIIGTLLASSAMTLWEYRVHPARSRELKTLAGGYATLGIGCAAAVYRHALPGALGSALSNLVIVAGYLRVLQGVAAMSGRKRGITAIVTLVVLALAWTIAGARWQDLMWNYLSAIPIALVSALTAWELLQDEGLKGLQSRNIAVLVAGIHAVWYAARAFALPWLINAYGPGLQLPASAITMYEGVLYSVVLPMTLLRLVREETHGHLLQESRTDYLTGLGTRRWFFEEGAKVLRKLDGKKPVSLLALDLDHFKAINDRYGHETGDQVLKSFGQVARTALGPDAMLARIGGEEFAALLPGLDGLRARYIGETLVQRFAEATVHRTDGVGLRATVSIGLAQSGTDMRTLSELLAAADQALYRAKALGGNRLELAGEGARRAAA
ncbi:sensor domain-containing diguanylate cyclase [Paraburkholderia phosphatilytica]|uniref:GGDEF domain-containing protein n=1 Tax=Paraburkholderia phosphatilytica TaxID=2282883 RepID=UPI000E4CA9A8|nr:GGDEF domain-containing protein [Paraburkholderia phosphatilytica]